MTSFSTTPNAADTACTPRRIRNARIPSWLVPSGWPVEGAAPALADLHLERGLIAGLSPAAQHAGTGADAWDVGGAPVLPGLLDAHTHLDKAFILPRTRPERPGLLAAIEAVNRDRAHWSREDLAERARQALQWAWESGTTRLRTHIDWHDPTNMPLAWQVVQEMTREWAGRIDVQQVNLTRLGVYADRGQAFETARLVAGSGSSAVLGGFIHTSNWDRAALRNLLLAAQAHGLDVDLHVDEELEPSASGLAETAAILKEIGFEGRAVCGHACALAVQDEATAMATLDAVAAAPMTLVCLPATNLLLQDAVTGRTPRQRGITLVKEARERGIPVLMASDNVRDPFCATGSFDPVDALALGAFAAQLPDAFDTWSQSICRADWLERDAATRRPWVGTPADLVIFPDADVSGWPSRTAKRVVLRDGGLASGVPPTAWTRPRAPGSEITATTRPAPAGY